MKFCPVEVSYEISSLVIFKEILRPNITMGDTRCMNGCEYFDVYIPNEY